MRSVWKSNSWGSLAQRKVLFSSSEGNRISRDGEMALGAGYLSRSVGTTSRSALAPVLVRRHPRTRIVNVWLILIVIVGGIIVLVDGLTRTPILERIEAWNGEYDPYPGALLFAGITLPLMFVYSRKAMVSSMEGLFLWFVFCTTSYTKDFSYIRWPGSPLFVTDVVLLILLVSIYFLRRRRFSRFPSPVSVLLLLFVGAGALSAARGFLGHREAMLVLRDSALIVYALFLPVGYYLFPSWLSIKRVAVWFLLGAALNSMNGLVWFVVAPGERRFIFYGIYILIALTGTMLAIASRLLRPTVGWIFAGVLCLGLMLANTRSLFVSSAVVLFVGLLGGKLVHGKIRLTNLQSIIATATVLISLGAFLFLRTETVRDFAERSAEELASGVLNSGEDPDWQFRLFAWKEAWRRFAEYPMAGEGFGVPFTFESLLLENDPRPHNTFLTVLYKMGLAGFLSLIALLIYFPWKGLQWLRRHDESVRVTFLRIVLLAQIAFCVYGMANLLLESPFLASLFWTSMGLGLRIIRMLYLDRSLPRTFSAG